MIIIIQALVKWVKFAFVTATTCSGDSVVGCTLRRVETMARGIWSRWKVSLCVQCLLSLSEVTVSNWFMWCFYDWVSRWRSMLLQKTHCVVCVCVCGCVCICVCVGAVCAPEAQKDYFPTPQIQDPCPVPTSACIVVTQKVIKKTRMKVLCFCFVYFNPLNTTFSPPSFFGLWPLKMKLYLIATPHQVFHNSVKSSF